MIAEVIPDHGLSEREQAPADFAQGARLMRFGGHS
jgi:hypothetical protein